MERIIEMSIYNKIASTSILLGFILLGLFLSSTIMILVFWQLKITILSILVFVGSQTITILLTTIPLTFEIIKIWKEK